MPKEFFTNRCGTIGVAANNFVGVSATFGELADFLLIGGVVDSGSVRDSLLLFSVIVSLILLMLLSELGLSSDSLVSDVILRKNGKLSCSDWPFKSGSIISSHILVKCTIIEKPRPEIISI